jgi:hypothetical protein
MSDDIYANLAAALDGLANGFPRTESNVELSILHHVFTPDEAAVAAALTGRPAVAADIARRAALEPAHVAATLESLAERGAIWRGRVDGAAGYRLAPFVVGFYEAHLLETHDAEFARLVEEYFRDASVVCSRTSSARGAATSPLMRASGSPLQTSMTCITPTPPWRAPATSTPRSSPSAWGTRRCRSLWTPTRTRSLLCRRRRQRESRGWCSQAEPRRAIRAAVRPPAA